MLACAPFRHRWCESGNMARYFVSAFRADGDARGKTIARGRPFDNLDAALAYCCAELVRARSPEARLPWTSYTDGDALFALMLRNPLHDRSASQQEFRWSRENLSFKEGASAIFIEREDYFRGCGYGEGLKSAIGNSGA